MAEKRKRGREPGFVMSHEHRKKISATKILQRVQDHALGLTEMTRTELHAAEVLLRKVLPDLAAVSVDVSGTVNVEVTRKKAADEFNSLVSRALELERATNGPGESVH